MEKDLFGICPYVTSQKLLTGKWTLLIMYYLSLKTMRFNELQRNLPNLTQATLSKQLRMMEKNGLLIRTSYNQIPPKVEYSLSSLGQHFKPVLDAIEVWGNEYIDFLKKSKQ
ncbi:MAG: helix-turn-helix transcriptional regulator [Clostridiales bacterium]|jgi:DNA-binding HxlR family transcriptional regulator|nr:helix-turn-helix transcriptional regulator [Clostridiales bacterium]MCI2191935.1 helix-turn-helix transcriptional regulator [Oscillospiraceae bacterium]MCI1962213.1 helix-turn-helix transcriptional regulator [Clostridiales bacterium]MCI2022655.1 helix-turn-helix transcriptional regulator [Clostridiales bacterium]MCI2027030.1 helix-turn-helix transcriptional regulator [Clostridiales bacterium]